MPGRLAVWYLAFTALCFWNAYVFYGRPLYKEPSRWYPPPADDPIDYCHALDCLEPSSCVEPLWRPRVDHIANLRSWNVRGPDYLEHGFNHTALRRSRRWLSTFVHPDKENQSDTLAVARATAFIQAISFSYDLIRDSKFTPTNGQWERGTRWENWSQCLQGNMEKEQRMRYLRRDFWPWEYVWKVFEHEFLFDSAESPASVRDMASWRGKKLRRWESEFVDKKRTPTSTAVRMQATEASGDVVYLDAYEPVPQYPEIEHVRYELARIWFEEFLRNITRLLDLGCLLFLVVWSIERCISWLLRKRRAQSAMPIPVDGSQAIPIPIYGTIVQIPPGQGRRASVSAGFSPGHGRRRGRQSSRVQEIYTDSNVD